MKPALPQGTRDFSAETVSKRNYIFNSIRSVFQLYGFQPLETPAMENLDTLLGKYGEEGDKLIFKILNNGFENAAKHEQARQGFEQVLAGKSVKAITERALRYDLTIPFARFVAMNIGQLTLPFKRYQIQPVWRADRPQRGRYREFYQCDADVVGSKSLVNEVELASLYTTVFNKLGIPVEIKINSRKILLALAELCGGADKMVNITTAIDKLDKIGLDKVKAELGERGVVAEQILIIEDFLSLSGDNTTKLAAMQGLVGHLESGAAGIKELEFVLNYLPDEMRRQISVDFTLARGLNYYTGIIFEVKALGVQMGSIGGGGRYDDLTGLFGVPNVAGVGISFGVDRIYDVMEELQLFPTTINNASSVLFFNLGINEGKTAFLLMQQLRQKGISAEMYHEQAKFDKQFKYAEKKQIPNVVILGSEELVAGNCVVKNLATGKQATVLQSDLANYAF